MERGDHHQSEEQCDAALEMAISGSQGLLTVALSDYPSTASLLEVGAAESKVATEPIAVLCSLCLRY